MSALPTLFHPHAGAVSSLAAARGGTSAERYQERRERGFCPRCGGERDRPAEFAWCASCREKARALAKQSAQPQRDAALRQQRRRQMLCQDCGEWRTGVFPRCKDCQREHDATKAFQAAKVRLKRQAWKAAGLCYHCGKTRAVKGLTLCGPCRTKHNKRRRKQSAPHAR